MPTADDWCAEAVPATVPELVRAANLMGVAEFFPSGFGTGMPCARAASRRASIELSLAAFAKSRGGRRCVRFRYREGTYGCSFMSDDMAEIARNVEFYAEKGGMQPPRQMALF